MPRARKLLVLPPNFLEKVEAPEKSGFTNGRRRGTFLGRWSLRGRDQRLTPVVDGNGVPLGFRLSGLGIVKSGFCMSGEYEVHFRMKTRRGLAD